MLKRHITFLNIANATDAYYWGIVLISYHHISAIEEIDALLKHSIELPVLSAEGHFSLEITQCMCKCT